MYISPMAIKRHKLYEEISKHVHAFVRSNGGDETFAEELSNGVVKLIANLFGGQNMTFPKDALYDMKYRDLILYKEYMGSKNIAVLSQKYGMSERGIRKVIERVREQLKTEKPSVKE
ncbi:Mor transcription activator family protein [Serratia marcescens]|uniref:Mor transcription activator family protein n=1 Tax=Serratia marcescens TaxID=615 RepID=UPI003A8A7B68